MNNGPMKHVPHSKKKNPSLQPFLFYTKKRGFLQVETTWKPMVSGCPCFNPTLHAFALLRAIHCKVLCASLSLGFIGWLDRVPFNCLENTSGFSAGKKTRKEPGGFFFPGKFSGRVGGERLCNWSLSCEKYLDDLVAGCCEVHRSYPIGSTGLIYLPTFNCLFNGKWIQIYHIHWSYG